MSDKPKPTEKDFRDCGYDPSAINFPLSDSAFHILCFEKNISFQKAPDALHFAPNKGEQTRLEGLAKDLRNCGYTASAIRFPLSESAIRVLCFENNVLFDKVPNGWRYAPNAVCQRRLEDFVKSPIYAVVVGSRSSQSGDATQPFDDVSDENFAYAKSTMRESANAFADMIASEGLNLGDDDDLIEGDKGTEDGDSKLIGPGTRQCKICGGVTSAYFPEKNTGHKPDCKWFKPAPATDQDPATFRKLSDEEIDCVLGFYPPGQKADVPESQFPGPVIVIDKFRYVHAPIGEALEKCGCDGMCKNEAACPYKEKS